MDHQTMSFNPVEIQLGATAYYVSPDSRQEIRFAIINRLGREDYFELSVRGIPAEWILLEFPVLQVHAGERREASLTIDVPPGQEGAFPAVLRATSQTYEDRFSEAAFDLRVVTYDVTQDAAALQSSGRLALSIDNTQYHVVPGSSVALQAVLVNQGLAEDTFQLSVSGLPQAWISSPTPVVRLQPGETRDLSLFIQPPQTPASRAGRYPFSLQVVSQTDPSVAVNADGALTVAAFSQFTSDLSPRHIDAGQTARLRVQNLSNIPVTYGLDWLNQNDGLEFVPSQSGPVQVQPGEVASIDFAVSPRTPNFFGSSVTVPYTVVVQSSEGDAQAHNGEVYNRALIPVWVLPAMFALCLTVMCGMGFLWNWNQERITEATDTARDQIALVEEATATAAYNQTAAVLIGQEDSDGDGLTNEQEQTLGTAPQSPDTDNDRMGDGDEVQRGLDPLDPDTDGDGILDGLDLDPLDPSNPILTATAQAGVPLPTETQAPTLTLLPPILDPTNTQAPANTQAPPATAAPVIEDTPTETQPPAAQVPADTAAPAPTATLTPTAPPQPTATEQPTATLQPTATFTAVPPTNTPTAQPTGTATETRLPLPGVGQNLIVFESDREGDPELFLFNLADGSLSRLTNSPGLDSQPAWSPDGSRIAFTSQRDGSNEIYVMNADGSDPVNLTNNPADDSYPVWSADGNRIIFASDRDGNFEIYQMSADGSSPVNLTNSPTTDTMPAWYSDPGLLINTERILFTSDRDGNNEIYAMNVDGADPVNLTNHPASDTLPAAPPQGGRIAFVSNRGENENETEDADIYLMDADGGNQVNLTNHPAADNFPAWAPGGDWISFTTNRDGPAEIYLIEVSEGSVSNLTNSPSEDQYSAWQ